MIEEVEHYAAWTEEPGARLSWSPFFAEPTEDVWGAVLGHNRQLNTRVVVRPQVTPGALTTTLRFDRDRIPAVTGWKPVMAGFTALHRTERIQHLADDDVRAVLRAAQDDYARMPLQQRPRFGVPPAYDSWIIIDSARIELLGLTLADAAARTGQAPTDLLCDLAIDDDLQIEVQVPIVNRAWRAAATLSGDESTLIGLGDSGAHVSTITNFAYTTDLLTRLVRDEHALDLETAVQRITSEPARFFGIPRRGELREGNLADICVIDLERL
jgi:N-acyl-D-aspartate/D-glutamate deacylase